MVKWGFSGDSVAKNPPVMRETQEMSIRSPGREDPPWRRAWQPTPVFLPGESHRQRSLAGHSPYGRKESDITEVTEPIGDKINGTRPAISHQLLKLLTDLYSCIILFSLFCMYV